MTIGELQNKTVLILGLGVEGIAAARYFLAHKITFAIADEKNEEELRLEGKEWEQVVSELKKQRVPLFLGQAIQPQDVKNFSVIVRSPGVSLRKEYLREYAGEVTSVTKLFFASFPGKIIGVTGTKGKGTTASLIYEMLKKAGKDAYLGGNIGKPPIDFLDTITPQSIAVLELSSFQLQDAEKSPHIAVMLMVTQEHLNDFRGQNFHATLEEYHEAKRNIVRFQRSDDMAILNTDYAATRQSGVLAKGAVAFVSRYAPVATGCFVEDNEVILRWNGEERRVISVFDILLPGAHNLENVCAAVMAAYSLGVSLDDIRFVLKTFKGLEHRLELVREIKGVRYYDDSFSTTPETAIAAIQAFTAPEILILGGSSKNSDFSELGKVIFEAKNIKAIIGIGIEWPKIKSKIQNTKYKIRFIEGLKTMDAIVRTCRDIAKEGDVVLLSPGCASFDMFQNYKDRGNQFKEQVNLL